jgi:cobalt/nickel transport system ATP-binding protein
MNPAVWTLDEPLSALDTRTQALVVSFLRALRRAGKTILFSTHEQRLLALADRIWSLDEKGTLKETRPAAD